MALETSDLGMPLFLFVSMLANGVFIVRAAKDYMCCGGQSQLARAPAVALLVCAMSELAWVMPCFVQCALVFFKGHTGDWSPKYRIGCDLQGFYSQFGSICSMLATLLVAWMSYRAAHNKLLPSTRVTVVVGASIFAFATLICLLPLVGATGPYIYTSGKFCYMDFHDPPQSIVMLLICVPSIIAVVALYGAAARGAWENKLDLLLLTLAFLSAWVLWPPASIIGLADGTFPAHYMISGGILGHAQALINPYLYGMRWRNAMVRHTGAQVESSKGIELRTAA